MVEIYNRLEHLQREVQTLRGELEEQAYTLDNLNKRQRELYLDLDRRIQQLEGTGARSVAPVPSGSATPPVPDAASSPAIHDTSASDKDEYEKAFGLLKDGRYEQAINAFHAFVITHPNSAYVPNALYWQGEASYVTRDFVKAMEVFQQVLAQYPAHSKAKDAMLKIGYIHYENKQWAAAREALDNVVARYPNTSASRLAKQRLDQMNQEKR